MKKILSVITILVLTSCSKRIATTKSEYDLPEETKIVEPGWNKTSTALSHNFPLWGGLGVGVGFPTLWVSSGKKLNFLSVALGVGLGIATYKFLESKRGYRSPTNNKVRQPPLFNMGQKDRWVSIYNKQAKERFSIVRENPDGISLIISRSPLENLTINRQDFNNCINRDLNGSSTFDKTLSQSVFSTGYIYVSSLTGNESLTKSLGIKADKILSPCFIHNNQIPESASVSFFHSRSDNTPFATYSGTFRNGIPNGQGKLTFSQSNATDSTASVMEGVFKDGRFTQIEQAKDIADQVTFNIDYNALFGTPAPDSTSSQLMIVQFSQVDTTIGTAGFYNLQYIATTFTKGEKHWMRIAARRDFTGNENLEVLDADGYLREKNNQSRRTAWLISQEKKNEELRKTREETGGANQYNDLTAIKKLRSIHVSDGKCYTEENTMKSPADWLMSDSYSNDITYYEVWARNKKAEPWIKVGIWKVDKEETCYDATYLIDPYELSVQVPGRSASAVVKHIWFVNQTLSGIAASLIDKY